MVIIGACAVETEQCMLSFIVARISSRWRTRCTRQRGVFALTPRVLCCLLAPRSVTLTSLDLWCDVPSPFLPSYHLLTFPLSPLSFPLQSSPQPTLLLLLPVSSHLHIYWKTVLSQTSHNVGVIIQSHISASRDRLIDLLFIYFMCDSFTN